MSRPIGSAEELERRRTRAMQALKEGQSPATIASVLGVHPGSVRRWRRMADAPGGLKARPHPGPKHGLSDDHLRRLQDLLLQGANPPGRPNQLWTPARVPELIRRHFGISYHPEHVRKIL